MTGAIIIIFGILTFTNIALTVYNNKSANEQRELLNEMNSVLKILGEQRKELEKSVDSVKAKIDNFLRRI